MTTTHILYDGPHGPAVATVEGETADPIAFAVPEEHRASARIVSRAEADAAIAAAPPAPEPDPVAKLAAFLASNPDVAALVVKG